MQLRAPEAAQRRAELIELATERSGVPHLQAEKDFWLTEVLRGTAAAAAEVGIQVVFKGGTSLSKAYGLIERFSEDVDVLTVLPGGVTNKDKKSNKKKLKKIYIGAAEHVALEPEVLADKTDYHSKYAVHLPYDTDATEDELAPLRPEGVLLELGAWGGGVPSEMRSLRSIVAEYAPDEMAEFEEANPVEVLVLRPERTAVEKLMILNSANDEPRRSVTARHYYDLHRLLTNEDVVGALADGQAALLAREVHIHTTSLDLPSVERPTDGLHTSSAFDPSNNELASARDAYDNEVLPGLLWPNATVRPSFEECCEVIRNATYL